MAVVIAAGGEVHWVQGDGSPSKNSAFGRLNPSSARIPKLTLRAAVLSRWLIDPAGHLQGWLAYNRGQRSS